LDNSAVHPEAYSIVEKIKDLKLKVTDLIAKKEKQLNQTRKLCYG
jgi:uncharacterized protein